MAGSGFPGDFDPDRLAPDLPKSSRIQLKVLQWLTERWWVSWVVTFLGVITLVVVGIAALSRGGLSQGLFFAVVGGFTLLVAGLALLMLRYGQPIAAEYLIVEPSALTVRRGNGVEVALTITRRDSVRGSLEVGLVCTELYDALEGHGKSSQRVTRSAVAYEEWKTADRNQPRQTAKFTVPVDAPFSYQGDCLSFTWKVSARDRRTMRRDPESGCMIWVTP